MKYGVGIALSDSLHQATTAGSVWGHSASFPVYRTKERDTQPRYENEHHSIAQLKAGTGWRSWTPSLILLSGPKHFAMRLEAYSKSNKVMLDSEEKHVRCSGHDTALVLHYLLVALMFSVFRRVSL